MRAVCRLCDHKDRIAIEKELASGHFSMRMVGEKWGLEQWVVFHHRKQHMKPLTAQPHTDPAEFLNEMDENMSVLDTLIDHYSRDHTVTLPKPDKDGNPVTKVVPADLKMVQSLTLDRLKHIEARAKLSGAYDHNQDAANAKLRRFAEVVITKLLTKYPEAKAEIMNELKQLEYAQ